MTDVEYRQEREEIAQIAMMLMDKYDVYYLLGAARAMLAYEIEAEQTAKEPAS